MQNKLALLMALFAWSGFAATTDSSRPVTGAAGLLADQGVRPGLVVHLDCGDGALTAELGAQPSAKVVQALSRSPESVEKARRVGLSRR